LSPAYDLPSTQLLLVDKVELALSLNGKKSNLKRIDFLKLGQNLNIPDKVIENCINKQIKAQDIFVTEIENCIMSDSKKSRFIRLIDEKCARLQV
jgi:serine/threonine-protein kinase HipA